MSTAPGDAYPVQASVNPTTSDTYPPNEVVTQDTSLVSRIAAFIRRESNFFRIHLLAFVFVPLIFSGIFYGSNGQFHIPYLDSLFLCYSAMTDTGLSTVNLSQLTGWQQTILYLLMGLGDVTVVAWIMVLIRKQYFKNRCEYVAAQRSHRFRRILPSLISAPKDKRLAAEPVPPRPARRPTVEIHRPTPRATFDDTRSYKSGNVPDIRSITSRTRSISFFDRPTITEGVEYITSPQSENHDSGRSPILFHDPSSPTSALRQRRTLMYDESAARGYPRPSMTILSNSNPPPTPQESSYSHHIHHSTHKYRGFGDFPGPLQIFRKLFSRISPHTATKLKRTMTIPSVTTLEQKSEKWLKFDGLVVGRNSDFRTATLSDEQLEELGGTEYRALRLLSYLVPAYFIFVQLVSFLIFGPWLIATSKYDSVFSNQYRDVPKAWYSVFILMSIYTGTGLDLCDTAMLPFQTAYAMIISLIFLLLVGNHAQPIFLRFIIWIGSRIVREGSELDETLSFLLKHPRRCFLYLFPSHQTWFLLIVLTALSILEWVSFGVLNLGLPVLDDLPTGTKYIVGLFQGIAVRASGLAIVPVSALAPACLFLYIVLMYIAVYPVAMCLRATNVYEEHSLGVFRVEEGEIQENLEDLGRTERVGRYLGWHLRHQLSNDIWWLVWGIFLITVIERNSIMDAEKPWFNLFTIIFELVSAFAGIGLSIGVPDDNYSFTGRTRKLSKLVVIVLMIRGRHRGLPVAVDRAVMLPSELITSGAKAGAQASEGDVPAQDTNQEKSPTNGEYPSQA